MTASSRLLGLWHIRTWRKITYARSGKVNHALGESRSFPGPREILSRNHVAMGISVFLPRRLSMLQARERTFDLGWKLRHRWRSRGRAKVP
jgi:hypothetical protein